ncbi:hypothetical protein ACSS6W_001409 [Trichoderma asperelloides]|uniref:Cyanovirin-N domain-containing protein n=2 Tax=Trichoderma asperellum TaxID=101201 RepID=A0A6V8QTP3_TRIAP|nr:hypothetical protein M441DRAFT_134808 [Trichoderma asperellum CBS 433.97]PTB42995.1 hypothetical protein M441DRAFT_134808 [Trichoderma asperellum CBS 433.97]UKZ85712.1 hypothetical protein TrAFT101_001561 [Trichoderma asperellum]GFP53803.1 hypothetical protein TASIC1_0003018100 [Trichoderma asperellum]
MLFSRDLIPTVLAMALSVTRAEAAIAIGIAAGFNVMWIEGGDPCRWDRINDNGQNPCNVPLANPLDNGFKYRLQGCGGPSLWLTNEDGSFNSNCRLAEANLSCNVHRSYICG